MIIYHTVVYHSLCKASITKHSKTHQRDNMHIFRIIFDILGHFSDLSEINEFWIPGTLITQQSLRENCFNSHKILCQEK